MNTNTWLRQSGASATPRRVKLCQIITQTHFGGAQKYICDIVNNLDENFDITIAYGEGFKKELEEHITNTGVKLIKLKYLKRNINIFYDKLALLELFFFFRKNKFDVIPLHSSKAGFIASMAGKLANIKKIIYTAHGWVFKEDLSKAKKTFYLFLEKFSARFKTKIICVSKQDYDLAISYKICKQEKLELIYNGLDKINYLDKETARKILFEKFQIADTGQKLIGTIANFYKNKGLRYLIKSANILNQKFDNLIFFIIGDGLERQNLESLIKQYKLQNFFLTGYIKEEANTLLKGFDIFTLSSIKEGLPYTLLEALNASNLKKRQILNLIKLVKNYLKDRQKMKFFKNGIMI